MSVDILPSRENQVAKLRSTPEFAGKVVLPNIGEFLLEKRNLLVDSLKPLSLVVRRDSTATIRLVSETIIVAISNGINFTSKGSERLRPRRGRSPRGVCPNCHAVYRLRDGHHCSKVAGSNITNLSLFRPFRKAA